MSLPWGAGRSRASASVAVAGAEPQLALDARTSPEICGRPTGECQRRLGRVHEVTSMTLALAGGRPVRSKPWPAWPRADPTTWTHLRRVLSSGRWTISGPVVGSESYERRFASAFARFHKIPYCVPTASGSASLTIALEAVGVTHASEVLVPGLTWVACASAVAGIGAIPVLVDIDGDTLCMSPDAAASAITRKTSAILLVHPYSSVAPLDRFLKLSREANIPLVEDCSQAHGASWGGRRVGTFGRIGVFSMQQTKVLASGEGGATVTRFRSLYDRLQQLRADGRRYRRTSVRLGHMELEEIGDVQGRNYCLSEFHAAILFDRLSALDAENARRARNGAYLNGLLESVGGITAQACDRRVDRRTYYHYCVRIDRAAFNGAAVDRVAAALTAELGVLAEPIDDPLNANVLYRPLISGRTPRSTAFRRRIDPERYNLPIARSARETYLTLPHRVLMGSRADVEHIAEAFQKVKRHSAQLVKNHRLFASSTK